MDDAGFAAFLRPMRPRLARAFVASYGAERGEEALAEALAYAWEHRNELQAMRNPAGYLYRVGQSRSRARRRRPSVFPSPAALDLPDVEPGLPAALERLSPRQRACVTLVHGYGMSLQETGHLLGITKSSVQRHAERGLAVLRQQIGAPVER